MNVKSVFLGALRLNYFLMTIWFLMVYYLLTGQSDIDGPIGLILLVFVPLLFLVSIQGVILACPIFFAKLFDKLFNKINLLTGLLTFHGLMFGALLSSVLFTLLGNLFMDNLYQFNQQNYFMVLMPIPIFLSYYMVCYSLRLRS